MHHWAGSHPPLFENVDSRKTVELASSRDLHNWDRVANRAPFMELSQTGEGRYDTGQIGTTTGMIRRNNELWFYYTGMKHRNLSVHDTLNFGYLDASAILMARLRLDGFVSLKGGIEWGSVITKPIKINGPQLRVNVDSWRGQLKSELLDAQTNQPIQGFALEDSIPIVLDSVDEPLRWSNADILSLQGRTVKVRFALLNAELYSYWIED